MQKVRLRLGYGVMAAVLAAPLALAVRAQNAPPAADAPPQPSGADRTRAGRLQHRQTSPTFRADINFVRVDVIVTDRQGNPVHDLRQEDFEVTEDGKPQTIQTFKLVNVTENAGVGSDPPREVRNLIEEQTEAARDDVRLFAMFLDDYHVRLENSMRAREPIAQFIENQLQPADMAGDHVPALVDQRRDADAESKEMSPAPSARSRVANTTITPRNAFEERYVHYVSTIEAERIRNQVTLSALKGLITRLGGLREGRKAILLISEGFTNSLPAQVQDPIATCNGGPAETSRGHVRIRSAAADRSRLGRRRRSSFSRAICCPISAASTSLRTGTTRRFTPSIPAGLRRSSSISARRAPRTSA